MKNLNPCQGYASINRALGALMVTSRPKLMIIDSDDASRERLARILSPRWVVTTMKVEAATPERLRSECPALVMVDGDMPVLVGKMVFEFAASRPHGVDVPVLLLSEHEPQELQRRARVWGADGFVRRSAGEPELYATLEWFEPRGVRNPFTEPGTDTLPLPPAREATEVAWAAPSNRGGILVGGRPPWLSALESMLRGRFNLSSVSSGAAIYEELVFERPLLLLLSSAIVDSTVPNLCRCIRRDVVRNHTPILFVGEAHEQELAREAAAAGANRVLLAPFHAGLLFSTISTLSNVAVRTDARLLVRIEVKVWGNDTPTLGVGFSRNLSASGLLLQSQVSASVGDRLQVRFFVPDRSVEISARARVARVDKANEGFALEFLSLPRSDRQAIEGFVRAKMHKISN